MSNCRTVLLLAITFSTSSAIISFIPNDKELVYSYSAHIKSATDIPDTFASEFYLFGNLRVQLSTNASLLVQLTNVTYKLYNGKIKSGYKQEFHDLPQPIESSDITRPFEVILNKDGQAESIIVDRSEKLYARNMHKALAALLQLKTSSIDFNSKKSETFITLEHSIYGKGRIIYTVLPRRNEPVVKKIHEPVSNKRMYQLVTTNLAGDVCEAPYEEPLAHDSHQVYIFKKSSDSYILKRIESEGGLYFYPFRAKSEAHYIHSSVSINLISINSIETPIEVHGKKQERDLTYDIFEPNIKVEESFYEMLGGRILTDDKTIITALERILSEMLHYLEKNHMTNNKIDIRKAHLSNSAVRLLRTCNSTNLENIYSRFTSENADGAKTLLALFYEMLPYVGTHASVLFIKKIVQDKIVDDEIAVNLIQTFSTYVRFPTEALLLEIEDVLKWGNETSKSVRKIAALSFGTLIHKTYQSELALANRHREDHDKDSGAFRHFGYRHETDVVNKFLKEHTIYQRYIDDFANKLKQCSDVESQLLYLQVIFNTKLPLAVPHLIPIVTGEERKQHDVLEMSIWALSHMLDSSDKIAEIYWPILTDTHQHTELRIAAYYVIIKTRPSLTGLLSIHHAMQTETNTEVFNFHYSYLQAMSQSNNPCNAVSNLNAAQILKFTRKPNQQASSRYFQLNFNDPKYGHGYEINGAYTIAARSRIFVLDINLEMFNMRSNYYLLFMKIGGLEKELSETVEFNLKNGFGLLNYDDLWKTLVSIRDMKEFHIQISISNNYHTTQAYYFDTNNLHEFYNVWKKLVDDKFVLDKQILSINYEVRTEIIFPTEMGMPATLEMTVPTITYKHLKMKTSIEKNITTFLIDSKFQGLRSICWGLDFYNPIVGVSQGVKRYHAIDSVLPLFMDVTVDKKRLSVSWKTHPDKENIVGLRSYSTNFVYIEDYTNNNTLQVSCAECKNWVQVTRGNPYRYNYTMLDNNGSSTGFASKVLIFDAERHVGSGPLSTLVQIGNESKPLLENFLTLLSNFGLSDIFQPAAGTQGVLLLTHPTVSQVDLMLEFDEVITQRINEFLPGIKFNPRMKYQLHNNDTVIKTVDVNVVIETNVGHTTQIVKVDIVSTGENGNDYEICINRNKTWTSEDVSSYISISTGRNLSKDMTVDIRVRGEQLEEQKTPFHTYEVCDLHSHSFHPDYHSMRCLAEHTSIKKYVYDINTSQVSREYQNIAKDLLAFFINEHNGHHNYYANDRDRDGSDTKIIVEYTNELEANIDIITGQGTHELTAISVSNLLWDILSHDNTHYSTFFLWMNYIGMVHTCVICVDKIQHELNEETQISNFAVSHEWTMVIADANENGIYLKKFGDHMLSLKLVYKSQALEVYPLDDQGEQFKIIFDGKELSHVMDHYKQDWFSYVIRSHLKSVIITIFPYQLHLDYTAEQLIVQIPKVDGISMIGPCVVKNNMLPYIVDAKKNIILN